MAANYLPNGENCTVLFANAFFKPKGATRFRHMGVVDSVVWTPEINVAEKEWKGEVVRTRTTQKAATLAISAAEMTWSNIKAAFMAAETDLIQEAGPINVTEEDVAPGELIELGAYGVTGVVVTDGTDELDAADWKYDPSGRYLQILGTQVLATVVVTGTAPAITAGQRKVLSMMAEDSGIEGEFYFEGESDGGVPTLLDGITAQLRPDGGFNLSSDNNEFQSVSLTGRVIRNNNNPTHPYGFAIAKI